MENSNPTIKLIGRDNELNQIENRLKAMRDGHGGGLALQGKTGIGKTRLLQAIREQAEKSGNNVIFVSCRGSLLRPTYPINEMIKALLNVNSTTSKDEQKSQLQQELDRLGLADLFAQIATVLRLPLSKDEQHFYNESDPVEISRTLRKLIEAQSRQDKHLLFIFDDLDQAHETTQSILMALAEELISLPALLFVTFDIDVSSKLKRTFGKSLMVLEGLDIKATSTLCTYLLQGQIFIDAALEQIWKHTEGNPYFLQVLLKELGQGDRLEKLEEEKLGIPEEVHLPSLGRLLLYRFQQLPHEQQELLQLAAVLGDGWRIGVLSTLYGRSYSDTVFEELTTLVFSDWLERTGTKRTALYYFPQRILRQVIYNSMQEKEREDLHRRAGDYYAIPTTGRRIRIEHALHHYLIINNLKRAMELIDMVLTQAKKSGDASYLSGVYRLGASIAAKDIGMINKQAEMAEALGDLYAREGNFRQAALTYSEFSPTTAPPSLLSKLGLTLLDVDPSRAISVLAQVSPVIPREAPRDLYWRVEAGLVWGLAQSGRIYEGIRRSRDILGKLGETAGFGSARTLMRGTLGMALFYHDDPVEAKAHLESARAGWGARGEQDGVLLINQILIRLPAEQITRIWLRFVLEPLLFEE